MMRFLGFAGLLLLTLRIVAGCSVLTPAEKASVAADAVKLATCNAIAHGCKMSTRNDAGYGPCWDEWDACMIAHGYADAGRDAR